MDIGLVALLVGWMLGAASPGPATLALSSTAMSSGRHPALALAAGITTGSAIWGMTAALGLSTIMLANLWLFEIIRWIGALYLLWLAIQAARRALSPQDLGAERVAKSNQYFRGLMLHLTNPKAVIGWGSVFAIALPPQASQMDVWVTFGYLITASALVFFGYAVVFAHARVATHYRASRRWFDTAFALLFGAASVRFMTLRPDNTVG